VKLLFDENLSRKLLVRLAELYPESSHVVEFDLLECPDREIWEFARSRDFVIVSTDSDFYELATTIGPPPKVVWLRRLDTSHEGCRAGFAPRGHPDNGIPRPIRNSASSFWIGADGSNLYRSLTAE
jgi:predicted nuclease of predicted toxin-antitoxin system